jgi:succinoglycan biosynthesis transport protein ExoP
MSVTAEFPVMPDQMELLERLRAYWRHRTTGIVVAVVSALITIAFALLLPPTYISGATILIEQQEIPQELVRSAITTFADQRVQLISQRVQTSQNLMALIDRYDLYPDIHRNKSREELLETMRDAITMKMISADVIDPRNGRPTQATIAFSVSYKSHSPQLALKVANDLTSLYLNENLNSRTQSAEQTSTFFTEEVAHQQQKTAELDRKLAEFKQQHQNSLPELTELNTQGRERTEHELSDVDNRIKGMDSQRVLFEAELAQINPLSQLYSDNGQRVLSAQDRLKSLESQLAGLKARYAPNHPDILNAEREIEGLKKQVKASDDTSDIARQLADAKTQLASAKDKYTSDHPDVIRLTRLVDELQKSLAAAPAQDTSDRVRDEAHADNPVYLQVKGELDSLQVERAGELKKRAELQAKLEEYERRLAAVPMIERDYRGLARDLDIAQQKFQEIRSKQNEVQISQNLETERKGERFTLIEAPPPPEKPISPNRQLILAAGLALSIALGIGVAVLRDALDGSIRGVGDIRRLLRVPPLAAIPLIVTHADQRRRRRRILFTWNGAIAGLIVIAASVHFFVRPLDVLWVSLTRRFGV